MEEMLNTMHVQVAALGTGEERFQESFCYFQNKYQGQFSATIGLSYISQTKWRRKHGVFQGIIFSIVNAVDNP